MNSHQRHDALQHHLKGLYHPYMGYYRPLIEWRPDPVSLGGDLSDALYRSSSGWLARVVRSLGGGDSTQDTVQAAFLKVQRASPGSDSRPLLAKVARNILLDSWRAQGRIERAPYQAALSISSPESTDSDQYEYVLLRDIVRSLPPPQREVFVLHRFGGNSYAEIADICGVSVKTVVQMRRVEGRFRITEVWYEPVRKRALAA